MTKILYMDDCYIKEFNACIVSKGDNYVILDTTAFSPRGGGLPPDTGTIIKDSSTFNVIDVQKKNGDIIHFLKEPPTLTVGDMVKCLIDWDRRNLIMRSHTACHLLASVLHRGYGALITGNQIDIDKSRMDFNIESFDRDLMELCISKTNEIIAKNINVKIFSLDREKAMEIPGIVKLAKGLPPELKILRIVQIGDYDIQADGGVHVSCTSEIGNIKLLKLDNKGKSNRRIYLTLGNQT